MFVKGRRAFFGLCDADVRPALHGKLSYSVAGQQRSGRPTDIVTMHDVKMLKSGAKLHHAAFLNADLRKGSVGTVPERWSSDDDKVRIAFYGDCAPLAIACDRCKALPLPP
jgi:hypothetical protein